MRVSDTLADAIDRERAVTRTAKREQRCKIEWRGWLRENLELELKDYCERQQGVLRLPPLARPPIEVPVQAHQRRAVTFVACLKKVDPAEVRRHLYRDLVRDLASGDLYRAKRGFDWPETFGAITACDRRGVWLRRRGQTETVALEEHDQAPPTIIAVDQADIGAAALVPLGGDHLEPLERQAPALFRADLVERARWHLLDMNLTGSSSAGCEILLVDRLLSAGAKVPILDEGARAKTWAKDVLIEERLRGGASVRKACREIVCAIGASPASGRSITARVDDEEKSFRERLTRRGGVERDPTEPQVRRLAALLMLEASVREAVQSAIGLAPHLAVVRCADGRRRGKIKLLEERISQATQDSVGGGLAAARDVEVLRSERDRLVDLDQWKILTNLLVSENLTDQVLRANATEAGNLIDRMLLDGAAGRG